ncbi:MAG TPA: KpsF/GutQ family sugar-phosphate isomerase [Thermodesulfobacteriota bacterium]|nr:KpsF/GutQ family sugar-phosphate isomerase [Thermodesulfobacteriota bacterium]
MKKNNKKKTIEIARRVLGIEARAVASLKRKLGKNFVTAVELILSAKGKVVVSGMGKSGIICQKMASTFASTGTSAFFLHPADGAHGDLGMLGKGDVLIAISNSGETEELIRMLPAIKRLGVKVVAMTGRLNSTLSKHSDVTIDIGVKEEACPLGLAPTASTTAALAMGDALAVVLLERRGFKAEDFAALHPAGSLGRRLLKVSEFMHAGKFLPMVSPETPMKKAILEMTQKRLGLTGVKKGKRLVGIITDGDLRRALEKSPLVFERTAGEIMTRNPKVVSEDALLEAALKLMEEHSITALFAHKKGKPEEPAGIIHLHDLIKGGVI